MSRSEPHRDPFPSTAWSRILGRDGGRDLELLAQAYWRPIRAYLAARLRLDDEAAADLAQEAFLWLMARGFLDRADPARGSFRGLLKTALARFAIDQQRRQAAGKRGGGRAPEPLDAARECADPRSPTPDQALDDAWRRELLERAQARLQAELEGSGRRTHYLVFRDYFLDPADAADYRALAARHQISTTDVSNWLDHAKRRYRELLRQLVQETVQDDGELQAELQWLFGPARAAGGPP